MTTHAGIGTIDTVHASQYRAEGFLVVRGVFSADQIAELGPLGQVTDDFGNVFRRGVARRSMFTIGRCCRKAPRAARFCS